MVYGLWNEVSLSLPPCPMHIYHLLLLLSFMQGHFKEKTTPSVPHSSTVVFLINALCQGLWECVCV